MSNKDKWLSAFREAHGRDPYFPEFEQAKKKGFSLEELSHQTVSVQKAQMEWLDAFEKYVGRKPSIEEFQIAKANQFQLTTITPFLSQPSKKRKLTTFQWGILTTLMIFSVLFLSVFLLGSQYYSRKAVAERYLKVAGHDFEASLQYEVWSDTKKPIKTSDLRYHRPSSTVPHQQKDLLSGDTMVKAGRKYLIFPDWKVAVTPVDIEVTSNTKNLEVLINDKAFSKTTSSEFRKILKHQYPGEYSVSAKGEIDHQKINLKNSKIVDQNTSFSLDLLKKSFTVTSNLKDGDLYLEDKKIGQLTNGEYKTNQLLMTNDQQLYVTKQLGQDVQKTQAITASDISDGSIVSLKAEGVLDDLSAKKVIELAYSKMESYADTFIVPNGLEAVFENTTENSFYRDVKEVIDVNMKKAQNRAADSINFTNIKITDVKALGKYSYQVDFTVTYDFYYTYTSQHRNSGSLIQEFSWSSIVNYVGDGSVDMDSSDYYTQFLISGSNGASQQLSSTSTLR